MSAGKTTVGEELARAKTVELVRVREVIRDLAGVDFSRTALLAAGADLEHRFGPLWLMDSIVERVSRGSTGIIVDAVRTVEQAKAMKARFPDSVLIHVTADREIRSRRFSTRSIRGFREAATFEAAEGDHEGRMEAEVRAIADCIVDTSDLAPAEAVRAALKCLEEWWTD